MHPTPTYLLPLLLAPLVAAQTLSTTCTLFNLNGSASTNGSYTRTSSCSFKISADVVCPSNTTAPGCSTTIGGFVTDSMTLSIDTTANATADLWTLIRENANGTLDDTSIDTSPTSRLDTTTFNVDAVLNGHVVFTPTQRCVNGTLGGCEQQPEFNGVAVEACAPILLPNASRGDAPVFEGTTNFVVTDVTASDASKCNPANTTVASDAPDLTCQHQANGSASSNTTGATPANAAERLRAGLGRVMVVVGLVGVAFVAH
ncbi:hypothetical protein LTR95_015378 [Oleoguttula sp. CCFEE 5521]